MWIMLNSSYVSVVQHFNKPDTLVVRGRFPGDVAAFLGVDAKLEKLTPHNDYRYRVEAERERVEAAVQRAVVNIDYGNFKDSCPEWRHAVYLKVWGVLHTAQREASAAGAQWRRRLAAKFGF